MLIVGPTRCGKTATILKPMIYQILKAKKAGIPVGLSVIEPKGDVAQMVAEISEGFGIDCVHIDPVNPNSAKWNVMEGDKDDVAEATVAVLKSLFGKQEAFFATVQELSSRKITLLLKELYGNNMDITDVLTNLREEDVLMKNVATLRAQQGDTELVKFFTNELLGSMREKYQQLVIGLRAQMENITSNQHLKKIITGRSSFNVDEHFEKGGVLAISTALGKLGRAGDAFGMFTAMHLQLATFRRGGTERTRVPHYLIIDEYSRYINPDVERFLSIAAEYRVAGILAIQSLGQLEVESGVLSAKAMKRAIMTSTRNKIVFGGLSGEDAQELADDFGKDTVLERDSTYEGSLLKGIMPKSYKYKETEKARFTYTMLMDGLPRFHYVHKLLQGGHPQPPGIAKGNFIPRDWKEQLQRQEVGEQEENRSLIERFVAKRTKRRSESVKPKENDAQGSDSIESEPTTIQNKHLQYKERLTDDKAKSPVQMENEVLPPIRFISKSIEKKKINDDLLTDNQGSIERKEDSTQTFDLRDTRVPEANWLIANQQEKYIPENPQNEREEPRVEDDLPVGAESLTSQARNESTKKDADSFEELDNIDDFWN